MKIRHPVQVREKLMRKHGWLTIEDVARGLGMSTHTVGKMFRGETIRSTSVIKLAAAMDEGAADIATFVS